MSKELVKRMKHHHSKRLLYNTVCQKVNPGKDFNTVYLEFLQFARQTVKEKGCIEFFPAPSNLEKKEFMLWEIWENTAAMNRHMDKPYTKKILAKNLTTLQWVETAEM